ncbi:uncharacterized protein LOC113285830 [Papaver somniferum]|uniref:uncharacterized protein LOC113285830 n=1 Tax=Papaver somniferum TaxID=3469 RepID=UPI000E6F9807|nr:uncharacterized protein LOC113285830 [Papaver somniferum]
MTFSDSSYSENRVKNSQSTLDVGNPAFRISFFDSSAFGSTSPISSFASNDFSPSLTENFILSASKNEISLTMIDQYGSFTATTSSLPQGTTSIDEKILQHVQAAEQGMEQNQELEKEQEWASPEHQQQKKQKL